MISLDFVIRIAGVIVGFPAFVGLTRVAMGRREFTGENIFLLGLAYYFLLGIVLGRG